MRSPPFNRTNGKDSDFLEMHHFQDQSVVSRCCHRTVFPYIVQYGRSPPISFRFFPLERYSTKFREHLEL